MRNKPITHIYQYRLDGFLLTAEECRKIAKGLRKYMGEPVTFEQHAPVTVFTCETTKDMGDHRAWRMAGRAEVEKVMPQVTKLASWGVVG